MLPLRRQVTGNSLTPYGRIDKPTHSYIWGSYPDHQAPKKRPLSVLSCRSYR